MVKLTAIISKKQLGQRLDKTLADLFPIYSRSCIKEWIINQHVLINDKVCDKPKKKVLGDEVITINLPLKERDYCEPQDIPLNIIYEDDDIIVINKPRNLIVHPGAGNPNGTILNALLHYYPSISDIPRAGIVHRLDKDTTGLMVVAKTAYAQIRLIKSFKLHKITREYEAIVNGHVKMDGTIQEPISRHKKKESACQYTLWVN